MDKKVELSQTSKKIKKLIKPKLAKRLGGIKSEETSPTLMPLTFARFAGWIYSEKLRFCLKTAAYRVHVIFHLGEKSG